jgi:hypothetical protein
MTVVVMTLIGLLMNILLQGNKSVAELPTKGGSGGFNLMDVAMIFAQDYVLYIISIVIHGVIIANVMYSKKYFLYKDDGLRAIRAYTEMLTQISLFNGLIPLNFFVSGAISMVGELK